MNLLKILYVEDDKDNREMLKNVLNEDNIGDHLIKLDTIDTFDGITEKVILGGYHLVILDIYEGQPSEEGRTLGLGILEDIQTNFFIPVIFFSGNTKYVENLKSQIVGVVTKGDGGIDGLKNEIKRLAQSNLPFIKERIYAHLEKEFKEYFWDIIHEQRDKFDPAQKDFSLGYLMLRKFGNSLSREKVSEIIGDKIISSGKVHPMQFYIYPTDLKNEFDSGEILEKDDDVYVILTPSCDFVSSNGRQRKVGKVLLVKTTLLNQMPEYKKYKNNQTKYKQNLSSLIESRKGDRYFFLPKTPFIENRVIDFQEKEMYNYEELSDFSRVAKLDSPFSEAAISSFIRYYNRIGFQDIDSEMIISQLEETKED